MGTTDDYTTRLEAALLALWPLVPPRVRAAIRDEEPQLAALVASVVTEAHRKRAAR